MTFLVSIKNQINLIHAPLQYDSEIMGSASPLPDLDQLGSPRAKNIPYLSTIDRDNDKDWTLGSDDDAASAGENNTGPVRRSARIKVMTSLFTWMCMVTSGCMDQVGTY